MLIDEIVRIRQTQKGQMGGVSVGPGNKLPFISKTCNQKAEVWRGSGGVCAFLSRPLGVCECM